MARQHFTVILFSVSCVNRISCMMFRKKREKKLSSFGNSDILTSFFVHHNPRWSFTKNEILYFLGSILVGTVLVGTLQGNVTYVVHWIWKVRELTWIDSTHAITIFLLFTHNCSSSLGVWTLSDFLHNLWLICGSLCCQWYLEQPVMPYFWDMQRISYRV